MQVLSKTFLKWLRPYGLGFILVWIMSATALSAASPNFEFSGRAKVIDGDSLIIGSKKVRLFGIDAFEYSQTCGRYACGRVAARELTKLVQNVVIRCQMRDKDQYGRIVAQCHNAKGQDIAQEMVRMGLAVDYRSYSRAYIKDETMAKQQKRGAWRYPFQSPASYRQR